jgi:hypothetical protein
MEQTFARSAVPIMDMERALAERVFPTVTLWNRLEGRPRSEKFDRALRAEVRDGLWMLTRQWQTGEFQGDDAGSPIFARVHMTTTQLDKYRPDGHPVEAFDRSTPLEAEVERRALAFRQGGSDAALDIRLLMGRQWIKMLNAALAGDFTADFVAAYPVDAPDPSSAAHAPVVAHPQAWSRFAAVAGRRVDGYRVYTHLVDAGGHAHDGIAALAGRESEVETVERRFVEWFRRLIYQPAGGEADAWEPSRMEYRFACSAPVAGGEKVLAAEEYYHGRLDWYNLDIDPDTATLGRPLDPAPATPKSGMQVLLPTPISFAGMPNTRWWTFEDRRTSFGDVKPDTTDIAKLMLMEFGLVYANDWFLIPYTLEAGSLARIGGMAVTNVFGERTWVEAAGRGLDDDWQRWAMFLQSVRGERGEAADTTLVLLPTVPKVQEGKPLGEVLLVRDEVANMVWAVENTVPLPTGEAMPGAEAAAETRAFHERDLAARLVGGLPAPPALLPVAKLRYEVMNSVPENWIPFLPVRVPGSNREVQLQRAAMPRIIDGDPDAPGKVRPRTSLLRHGLDQAVPAALFVHEEEVPRAGVRVTQSFQRTRWRDGRVWLWLGVRKQTGRGEAASGLAFDRLLDVPDAG